MLSQNLVMGFNLATAYVKLGTYGQAEGSATDLGRTDGGVELTLERTMKEVDTDQDAGPTASKEVRRMGKIKFKLAEATLANLAVALNLPASVVSAGTLSLGGLNSVKGEQYFTLYLNTDGPSGGNRKYTFYKVAISGNGMHAYKKDNHTVIELDLLVLWDPLQSTGKEMGIVVDSSSDTTAPTVALTTPSSGGTVTAVTKNVVVWTITEANLVDQSTVVYGKTFAIFDINAPTAPTLVAGSIVYDATAKTVTFTPTSNWAAAGNKYMSLVDTGLKDSAGNALASASVDHFASV